MNTETRNGIDELDEMAEDAKNALMIGPAGYVNVSVAYACACVYRCVALICKVWASK